MLDPQDIRADFERIVQRPDPSFDLARAALLVAAESSPDVDVDGNLAILERWALDLRGLLTPDMNNLQKLARLRRFLFDELGFRGDHQDYYNPSNSLLHEVMVRRRGIPLTLSILFLEMGWRIGIPLEGVGFPGRFLVRLTGEERDLLLDPFTRGMSVHEEDCRHILKEISGGRIEFQEGLLASVTKRDMIARLLLNLKGAYLRVHQDEQALSAVERLLVIHPEDAEEGRDRGLLLYRLQRYGPAFDALRAYLQARPEAPDRESIERHAHQLRQLIASLN
jgi:regulator of sirC expression with transglutaminase-like and TPR domain